MLYFADVLQLVKDHDGLLPHAYTDDTQILGAGMSSRVRVRVQHGVSG